MNNLVHLNIFTNTNANKEYFDYLKQAYDSFVSTWRQVPTTIYFDPHPNEDPAFVDEYKNHLMLQLPDAEIVMTNSHREGWRRTFEEGTAEYVFNLEHDFVLQNINHSLEEIIGTMQEDNLVFMQFQKHANNQHRYNDSVWGYRECFREVGERKRLRGTENDPIPNKNEKYNLEYFTKFTPANQPYLVHRETWKNLVVPYIKQKNSEAKLDGWKGRGGIERPGLHLHRRLLMDHDIFMGLYGNFTHPATALHIDARKQEHKVKHESEPWKPAHEY